VAGIIGAAYAKDLSAAYVAFGTYVILYMLHLMNFKLNKSLDAHEIIVTSQPFIWARSCW